MKKTTFLFIFVIGLWLCSFLTFNPITDYQFINKLHHIIGKVEKYESMNPIADSELPFFYQYVDFSEEELLFIEKNGVNFTRIKGDYLIIVPIGFDRRLFYYNANSCWYGQKFIVGFPECSKNLIKELGRL